MSLATFPTTAVQRRAAGLVALLILCVAALGIPFASLRGEPVPAFMPINVTMIAIVDFVTAFLLFRQSVASRLASVGVLGAAYLWTGTIVIAYLLMFPDGAGQTHFFGAGPQSAIWLWVLWKVGFIALVLGSVIVEFRASARRVRKPSGLLAWLPALVIVVAVTLAWFAATHAARLPILIVDRVYAPAFSHVICPVLALGCALAGGLLFARSRASNVAYLWLIITCIAVAAEVLLTAIGSTRYSVGFYAARTESLVAASVVLFALLHESGRLAAAIAAGEEQARRIIENVADALITIDSEGAVRDTNPAARALFRYDRAAFATRTIDQIVIDYDRVRRASRGASTFEGVGRRSDGSTFPLELSVGAAGDAPGESDERAAIIIARDITARKRAESAIATARDQAIETGRLKAQFLARMSHEIRTPINAVIGMTELLLRTELVGEKRAFAETVHSSAASLLDVINDILDFSKIEAGKMELESVAFAPGDAVEAAVDILAPNARAKSLILLARVDPDVPAAVLGDANRLRQVLLNLIGNAIKFTATGEVLVRVSRASSDATICFTVRDTGIGIAPATREQLFEPFHQVDGSTSRRFGGSGLGLSISKKLVEMMGGTIAVESTPGAGSTFTFDLPLEELAAVDAPPPVRPTLPAGFRALVVDPSLAIRETVRDYLLQWGAERVVLAANATEARESSGIDVAIVATPLEVAFHATDDGPRLIVAIERDESQRGRDAVARGFSAYVRKPMHRGALSDALAYALTGAVIAAPIADHAAAAIVSDVRILLAEDHPVNQKLAMRQLEKLGYRADVVANGREAVAAIRAQPYTLILMDCQMPELDGFAATRAIRAYEREHGGHVPIVAMTASALDGDRDACVAAGMDDYLSKPVQMGALADAIERVRARVGAA